MLDLINNIQNYSLGVVPLIFFVIGITSSLHCIGMCGGFALLASSGKKSSLIYQIGRLMGYFFISILIFSFSKNILEQLIPSLSIFSWVFISLIFIFMGIKKLFPKKKIIAHPTFYQKILAKFMSMIREIKSQKTRAFLIGSFSVLLPCGVLYMVLFSLISLNNLSLAIVSVLSFWLGTLPVMHFGSNWIRTLIERISYSAPRTSAIILIILGVSILSLRLPSDFNYKDIQDNKTTELNCH